MGLEQLRVLRASALTETLLRYAGADEIKSVAKVWYEGLKDEPGSPWADYLTRWTPVSAAKWFLDSQKRLGARFLVAEKEKMVVGMNGMIIEKRSGKLDSSRASS